MRKSIIAIALLLSSQHALAAQDPNESSAAMSNFNYDYFEARIGISPITYGAGFSMSIHPNAHFLASVESEFENDINASAGLGFHAPINNWADLVGEMNVRYVDEEGFNNDLGMDINLGIRQWLGPQLEIGGSIGYVSIDDEDDVVGKGYVRFHATELFSMGAEARINDFYGEQVMLSARFKY